MVSLGVSVLSSLYIIISFRGRGPGRGRSFGVFIRFWSGRITGSDLCFSIRSELLVDEPAGGKLGEGGVRGGKGVRDRARAGPKREVGGLREANYALA